MRKVSEIYDRIAFGGVGRYNEYDQLRVAGARRGPKGPLDAGGFVISDKIGIEIDIQLLAPPA